MCLIIVYSNKSNHFMHDVDSIINKRKTTTYEIQNSKDTNQLAKKKQKKKKKKNQRQ
ncbi:hypothetical protein HanRHA438_Chr06g0275871 [Helianthus annuus]|nr:hypothetical protein HanRHA438_Chr06g0275871 [Helianthus annuus]